MAANDRVLKRAYQISLPGATEATAQIKKLEAAFEALRKKKLELNGELATQISGKDAAAVEELRKRIAGLEAEMKKLSKQRADAGKEALNQARAEQALANARAADARAVAETARADRERTTATIAQERELDRLIDREEKQTAALEKQRQKAQAASGSYNALYQEYRELYNLMKATPEGMGVDFRGQSLGFDEAIAKLKELAKAEQDFRRQFSRDGLLVGEYTSGIIQAFKQAGLDDLVSGQITKGKQELDKLNQEFEQTKQLLSQIGVTGQGNLEVLERSLIENRQQAAQLERQLGAMQDEFRGVGDVGNQISASLSEGFRNLKDNIVQLILSYVGFQALLATTQSVFSDTITLDSQASALKVVSKETAELARNEEFLREITDRLGLQILGTTQSFKSFYAAATEAGISADKTREIYEAAAATGANLKLSQEDINAVFLAFSQIASKGKVQAEELRGQIGERVPGAFAVAARAIGVTQAELNKMLENGQVIANDFLPKFAAELQRTFGGDSTERVEGLQASINRLRNQFTMMIAENQQGLTTLLSGFIKAGGVLLGIIGFLIGNLPLAITLLSAWALGWAVLNKEVVIANARLLLVNAQLIAGRIALGLVTAFTYAYSAALAVFTGATTVATGAVVIFNNVLRANPLGLILTLLALVAAGMTAFAGAATGTTEALAAQARQMQLNADLQKQVASATTDQISKLQALTKVVTDNRIALDDRKKALAELIALNPTYLNGLTLENIKTREGIGLLRDYVKALRDKAAAEAIGVGRAKAYGAKLEAEANAERALRDPEFAASEYKKRSIGGSVKDVFTYGTLYPQAQQVADYWRAKAKEQDEAIDFYDRKVTDRLLESARNLGAAEDRTHAETMGERKKRLEETIKQKGAEIDKLVGTDIAGARRLQAEQKALQKELDDLNGKEDKTRPYGGARLSGEQRDAQRDAEAAKDAAIRAENRRFEELKQLRALDVTDETTHLRNLERIETEFLDKKLATLSGKNAAERKLAEELRDKKFTIALQTAQKVFEVEDEYAKRAFDAARSNAENTLEAVRNSDAGPLARAEAQVAYLGEIETATRDYYAALTKAAGENKNLIAAIEREKAEALRGINRDQNRDLRELQQARFDFEISQLERVRDLQEQILRVQTSQRRIEVLGDDSLSPERKQRALNRLDDEAEVANLANQIDLNNREIEAFRRKYGVLATLNKDYNELVTRNAELTAARQLKMEQNAFNYATGMWNARKESLQSYLTKRLDLDATEIQVLQQGAQIGRELLQNYFAGEQERIDRKRSATQERLDLEKSELLAEAQSNNERRAIEKQYEKKKQDAEKEAARERKELALRQLEVETALGIAKTLASTPYPFNIVLAAAQTFLFARQRARIQAQKFEYGGMPAGGGDISGKRHSQGGTPFRYGGADYEAEAGELAIINRRSAASSQRMTVTGTPRQIASAINEAGGGVRFAPGAAVRKYEYGGMLQAPRFVPRSYGAPVSGNGPDIGPVLEAVTAQAEAIAATADQVRQLKVVLVTNEVTTAQRKEVLNTNVATI